MSVMTNDDPEPIYVVKDVDDNDKKPLFPNKEDGEGDFIPIVPSPGYDANNYLIDPYQSPGIPSSGVSSPILHSIKEPDSDGNSMGVLYQSTVGSVNLENREGHRNDLGSRLNSPLISGRVADSSMIQMDPLNLDPGRFSSTPFGDTKGFFLSPTFEYPTAGRPSDADVPFLSPVDHQFDINPQPIDHQSSPYKPILQDSSKANLSYTNPFSSFSYQQGIPFSPPSFTSTQPARTPLSSSLYESPEANGEKQYLESIPAYVYDTIQQHNGKPHWFQYLTAAKNVRVPVLQASSVIYQSLLDASRDVFMIEGVLDGCTYPLSSLSIPYYIKELGCYYDVSVQTLEGMQFKCRLAICDALFQLQKWKVCVILESSTSNHLASYSHGTIIKEMDWVEKLNEFEKKERPKNRENSNIVTPKSILFMTPDSLYDSKHVFAIPNSIIYVQSGVIRVYYYPVDGKNSTESFQNSSQLLTSFSLVMYVEVKEGQHLFIPSGRLFIIQAVTKATVIISRFLCGLQLKRQITSYRQLYNDSYDESFKWQFWKVNWLAAYMYLRGLRISQGVKVEPCCLPDTPLSSLEKLNIPFLIVALKILHEIYGSKQNSLQQFEVFIAEKVGCLGPLDTLMELSTRCRDNVWIMNGHRLQHPDAMSTTSEDTMAVMDVSPYPDSIDSNEFIDDYVEDASIQEEEKDDSDENWEFRCLCGVEGHNYDDGREMVQCSKCHVWCHCECVHYDSHSNSDFYCPWCANR